jgi:hypothetical protein
MPVTSSIRLFVAFMLVFGGSLFSGAEIASADALPRVTPGAGTVVEGNSGSVVVHIPVNLSAPSTVAVTADWVTIFGPGITPPAPATPGLDFEAASGTVTFAPGVTSATIDITVFGDVATEPDEQIIASFRNPTNATIGGYYGLGVGVITNDDIQPRVVPGAGTVVEGDSGSVVMHIPVTLSAPSTVAVTADWVTIFGPGITPPAPATPGLDFEAASGTVTFAPGVTSATIDITVFGDVVTENDEQIIASFRNPTNATIGGFYGLGVGIIHDDDTPVVFQRAVHHAAADGTNIAAADFNRDGSIDLAIASLGSRGVAVLPNDGNGRFDAPGALYNVGRNPDGVAAGDMDGDGAPDLVVGGSDGVQVLRNDGHGTFTQLAVRNVGTEIWAVAVADLNGDGALDVAATAFVGTTLFVLTNRGDGTFDPAAAYPTGINVSDVTIADLNGDGSPDCAVADSTGSTGTVSVLLNHGDGTLAPRVSYDPGVPFGNVTRRVAAVDLDGDNAVDLAATTSYDVVSLFANAGGGAFAPARTAATGDGPDAIAAADVDGDGTPDLLVTNVDSNDVTVLLNDGSGGLVPGGTYAVGTQPSDLVIADLNGDGRPDVAVTSYNSNDLSVLLHATAGSGA